MNSTIQRIILNLKYFRSHWIEVAFISVNILFIWAALLIGFYEIDPEKFRLYEKFLKNFGVHQSNSNVSPVQTERVTTADNAVKILERIRQESKELHVKWTFVISSPLNASFRSSTPTIRGFLQRQYLLVDYHASVCLLTNELLLVLDKMSDGIYISWGKYPNCNLSYFNGELRPEPIKLLVVDESKSLLPHVFIQLVSILEQTENRYDLIRSNCQNFAKEIFDKAALRKTWRVTSITDFTSPLTLFSGGRDKPVYILLWTASIIYELFLLIAGSERSFHSQLAACLVIVISLLMLFCTDRKLHENYAIIKIIGGIAFVLLQCAFIAECMFYVPFGTIRKRGMQYVTIWKSGSALY